MTCQDNPLILSATCQDSSTANPLIAHSMVVSTHSNSSKASGITQQPCHPTYYSNPCLASKASGVLIKHAIKCIALTHTLQHQSLGKWPKPFRANTQATCLGHAESTHGTMPPYPSTDHTRHHVVLISNHEPDQTRLDQPSRGSCFTLGHPWAIACHEPP